MQSQTLYSMELSKALILLASLKHDRDALLQQKAQLETQDPAYLNNVWMNTSGVILNKTLERLSIVYRYLLAQYPIIQGKHAVLLTNDIPELGFTDPTLNYCVPVGVITEKMMKMPKAQFDHIISTNPSLSLQVVMSSVIVEAMYGDESANVINHCIQNARTNFASNVVKLVI